MPRRDERGFVLISAMWLLMLAGSIAALLMLRGLADTRAFRDDARAGRVAATGDEVLAVVIADLLLGKASLAQVPSTTTIAGVGSGLVPVRVDFEQARLDPNHAPPEVIDGRLHDAGYSPDARASIIARIAALRSNHQLIGSFAAVEALAAGTVPVGSEVCLDRQLSPFGGAEADQTLIASGRSVHLGDVIRVRVGNGAAPRTYVARITGQSGDPYGLLDWYSDYCPQDRAA